MKQCQYLHHFGKVSPFQQVVQVTSPDCLQNRELGQYLHHFGSVPILPGSPEMKLGQYLHRFGSVPSLPGSPGTLTLLPAKQGMKLGQYLHSFGKVSLFYQVILACSPYRL